MCNIVKLNCAKHPLPIFEGNKKNMFLKVLKYIDKLHLRNHQASCTKNYNSEDLIVHGIVNELNTQIAEQTFAWLGRLKRIFCAMPKRKHLFLLDTLVRRHNEYVIWCQQNRVTPNLPQRLPDFIRGKEMRDAHGDCGGVADGEAITKED